MKRIKVFAPGTVANLGCGFDVMGLTLDGVGDVLEIGVEEGLPGLEIHHLSGVSLPSQLDARGAASGRARPRRPPRSTG